MPNRILLALSESRGVRNAITSIGATRRVAYRFVAGDDLSDAIRAAQNLGSGGMAAILDYLGENVTNAAQADAASDSYIRTLDAISNEGMEAHISVKLTQLGLDLSVEEAISRLEKITSRAAEVGTTVAIDMEAHPYTDGTIETYRRLRSSYDNLVLCLQAYLKRTDSDVRSLEALKPSIRLCKGAYKGPREIVYRRKATDRNFLHLAESLVMGGSFLAVATHDERIIRGCLDIFRRLEVGSSRYEFQMLYGVRRELQARLVAEGETVRVYIPFGDEWYPYLMRRLAERPANLRFFLEALTRG